MNLASCKRGCAPLPSELKPSKVNQQPKLLHVVGYAMANVLLPSMAYTLAVVRNQEDVLSPAVRAGVGRLPERSPVVPDTIVKLFDEVVDYPKGVNEEIKDHSLGAKTHVYAVTVNNVVVLAIAYETYFKAVWKKPDGSIQSEVVHKGGVSDIESAKNLVMKFRNVPQLLQPTTSS